MHSVTIQVMGGHGKFQLSGEEPCTELTRQIEDGTRITITAIPDEGYKLSRWNDQTKSNPKSYTIREDKVIQLHFTLDVPQASVTLTSPEPEKGYVKIGSISHPESLTKSFDLGSSVTIYAIPKEGYSFVKWSDDDTNATRTITLTENVSLNAIFEATSPPSEPEQTGSYQIDSITFGDGMNASDVSNNPSSAFVFGNGYTELQIALEGSNLNSITSVTLATVEYGSDTIVATELAKGSSSSDTSATWKQVYEGSGNSINYKYVVINGVAMYPASGVTLP